MATSRPTGENNSLDNDSNTSSHEPKDVQKPTPPPSPPNGGTEAWLQVLGSFLITFNNWVRALNEALFGGIDWCRRAF